MKSHFIKNTNNKYSIREDGVVINNKRNKPLSINIKKHQSYSSKYSSTRINNKTVNFLIETLLFEYFNIQKCRKCNCDIKNTKRKWYCIKCNNINQRISTNRWQKNNPDKVKEISKAHSKIRVRNLHDTYIAGLLQYKTALLPQEIITAKRNQLLLHRQCKNT